MVYQRDTSVRFYCEQRTTFLLKTIWTFRLWLTKTQMHPHSLGTLKYLLIQRQDRKELHNF